MRNALAGAFILNVVHIPALFRLREYKLLKSNVTSVLLSKYELELCTNNSKPNALVETNLFIYDFDTEPSYK